MENLAWTLTEIQASDADGHPERGAAADANDGYDSGEEEAHRPDGARRRPHQEPPGARGQRQLRLVVAATDHGRQQRLGK